MHSGGTNIINLFVSLFGPLDVNKTLHTIHSSRTDFSDRGVSLAYGLAQGTSARVKTPRRTPSPWHLLVHTYSCKSSI